MSAIQGLTCGTCRWWANGECHHRSPAVIDTSWDHETGRVFETRSAFPPTQAEEFCGDWEVKLHPNERPMFALDGTMLDENGNRSIFDDVDK